MTPNFGYESWRGCLSDFATALPPVGSALDPSPDTVFKPYDCSGSAPEPPTFSVSIAIE